MSRCKFALEKPFEGGASCLKQTTAGKKSRLLSRSLAFISIFCVLALLFTSLTPVVFADDMVSAVEDNQGGTGSQEPNGGNTDPPANPGKPGDSVDSVDPGKKEDSVDPGKKDTLVEPENNSETPKQAEQAGQPANLQNAEKSVDQGTSDPKFGQSPVPENNDSALNATLVINEVVDGATEISGNIKTDGDLLTHDLSFILEIENKLGVKTYEMILQAPVQPEWKIALPDEYPKLVAGDKIKITIKIPETEWELSKSAEVTESVIEISDDNIPNRVMASKLPQPTKVEAVSGEKPKIKGNVEGSADRNIRRRVFAYAGDPTIVLNQIGISNAVRPAGTFSITSKKPLAKDQVIYLVVKQEKRNDGKWEPDPDFLDSDPLDVTVAASDADDFDNQIIIPDDEFLVEDSFVLNDNEKAEIFEAFKKKNPKYANKMKGINIGKPANNSCNVSIIYEDDSVGQAKTIKLTKITERSAEPQIDQVYVADDTITIKFASPVTEGTKVTFVTYFRNNDENNFDPGEGCTCKISSKTTSTEFGGNISGNSYTFNVGDADLELNKDFGIIVKEPKKLASCTKSQPVLRTPVKTKVRDPRKLTDEDKEKIRNAIRSANTTKNGKSKLPDLFQGKPYPAIIEFDKDGNVTIISPNDVVVDSWDSNFDPVFAKNPDGTYKIKDGAKVFKFPAKDLVKNIAPKSPAIEVNTDTGTVTITPPAYKNAGDDTDLASYTITYKDASDADKTVTLTRTVDGSGNSTWSAEGGTVGENGAVTLEIKDLAVGGTITAKAKDNGGLEGDTNPLESDPVSKTLETASVTFDANGGTGNMKEKKLNKGCKYTLPNNGFNAPENQEFDTWEVDGKKVAAGTEITVTKDTEVKALWKDIMVTITYDPNGGKWNDDTTDLKIEKHKKGTVITIMVAPVKEGFDFQYWEGSKHYPDDQYEVLKDHRFTAQWAKKPDPKNPDDKPQNPPVNPGDKPRGFEPIPGGNTPNLQVIPGTNPQILRVQPAPSASTPRVYKTLPRTGESNRLPLLASALLALLGGALILSRKRS